MTRSYKISESAINLRPGNKIFESDGGGLWYHVATVYGISEGVEVIDGRYRSTDMVILDLDHPGCRRSTARVSSAKVYTTEVIA